MEPLKRGWKTKGSIVLSSLLCLSLFATQLIYPLASESYVNNDTLLRLLKGEHIKESLPIRTIEHVALNNKNTTTLPTLSSNIKITEETTAPRTNKTASTTATTTATKATTATKQTATTKTTSKENQSHKVVQGDTLYDIAIYYGMRLDDLIKINNLNPDTFIKPGQVIAVHNNKNVKSPATSRTFASRGAVLSTMQAPLQGRITSPFGPRNNNFHHGVDIAGDTGDTIRSVQSGKVTFAGWRPVYGQTVIIEHPHGVKTLYAHASKILVKEGQSVEKGQAIAQVGATGVSTGPHLHLEIHIDQKPVNPLAHIRSLGL
ncbi:peptidoglycan DD-metalloendopeptidase family protein [Heliorestis acidaminivorans]|uniref:Peptidoglycan DD-metalloendopeptidase family protein n=1 Tax=Heliorestis acidaminivorans TaxID=553427 RepID=A0A6I0F4Q2_9FIRM|nr:peptidoglycan DD-metalloendopeptidase family protein [Heliorestis acidaminivorans]KAB2953822.1 peptidoglycan DD-metalloendopeptidase family protein [Heliorestis acidaminivorans]